MNGAAPRSYPKGMHATHSHVSGLERHAPSQHAGVGPRDPGEAASSLAQALRSDCRQRGSRHTYTRFMMGAFHNGRRCGTCCDGNDTVSPMCAGADWDGAFQLRKTSLLEVEARCSRDEACEGYYAWNKPPNYTDVGDMVRPVTRWGTTGGTFRFKSGKVYGWAKLERIACSWPDLRRRAADADARAAVPGPEHLLAPMREWADEAWARLQQSGDLGRMQLRADQLRNFTSSRLPSAARELPVLYLFGGADLLTTSWLFPSATRHTLMSALPLGQPSCFLQSACRAQAHKAAADYFQDWAHNSYAWTQSEYMVNYWFTPKVGVLPALLLSLRILGERLVAMERSSSYDEITLVGDSVETRYILEYGQLALQGLSSAPGHASGCPKPRPASASLGQPRPIRPWAARAGHTGRVSVTGRRAHARHLHHRLDRKQCCARTARWAAVCVHHQGGRRLCDALPQRPDARPVAAAEQRRRLARLNRDGTVGLLARGRAHRGRLDRVHLWQPLVASRLTQPAEHRRRQLADGAPRGPLRRCGAAHGLRLRQEHRPRHRARGVAPGLGRGRRGGGAHRVRRQLRARAPRAPGRPADLPVHGA